MSEQIAQIECHAESCWGICIFECYFYRSWYLLTSYSLQHKRHLPFFGHRTSWLSSPRYCPHAASIIWLCSLLVFVVRLTTIWNKISCTTKQNKSMNKLFTDAKIFACHLLFMGIFVTTGTTMPRSRSRILEFVSGIRAPDANGLHHIWKLLEGWIINMTWPDKLRWLKILPEIRLKK